METRPRYHTFRFPLHSQSRPSTIRSGEATFLCVRATVPGTRPDVTERVPRERKSGTDESRAGRNRVCTSGDEACLPVVLPPRGEATGSRQAATAQFVDERASTRDFVPDPETGVAPGFTRCRNMRSRCRCSMCPAIHINSRSWLRSSSTHEPSDPPLRVVSRCKRSNDFVPDAERQGGSGRETNERLSPVQVWKP